MGVGLEISVNRITEDEAVVEYLDNTYQRFERLHEQYGDEIRDTDTMKKLFNSGALIKSAVRDRMYEYIKSEVVVFTLHGSNHTDICLSLEGTKYSRQDEAPIPPLHWNCKSTLEPTSELFIG